MNKQRFKQIVRDYHELSAQDRIDLHELVKDHPFSQILHTLVAKSNNDAKTDIAQQSLNYAAMYASDRSVLKDIIQSKPEIQVSTQEKVVEKPAEPDIKPEEPKKKDESEKSEEEASQDIISVNKGKPLTLDTEQLEHSSDNLIKEVWEDLAALKKSKSNYLNNPLSASSEEPKKKSTRKSSLNTATAPASKEKSTTTRKRTAKTTSAKTTAATKAKTTKAKSSTVKATPKTTAAKTTTKAKATPKTTTKTKSTTKTNVTKAKLTTKAASTGASAAKTTSKTTSKSPVSTKKTAASKKKTLTRTKVDPKTQKEIIERFIDEEPRISAKTIKVSETDQKDLSEKSTVYSEDLVSENLAQILLAQGKKEKAVEIYKKLIWKFPQKKSYFAAQIKKIQNK